MVAGGTNFIGPVSIRAPLFRAGRCGNRRPRHKMAAVSIRAPLFRAGRLVPRTRNEGVAGVSIRAPLFRAGRYYGDLDPVLLHVVSIRAPLFRAGRSALVDARELVPAVSIRAPLFRAGRFSQEWGFRGVGAVSIRAPLFRAGRCGSVQRPRDRYGGFNPRPALSSGAIAIRRLREELVFVSIRAPLFRAGRYQLPLRVCVEIKFQSAPRSFERGDGAKFQMLSARGLGRRVRERLSKNKRSAPDRTTPYRVRHCRATACTCLRRGASRAETSGSHPPPLTTPGHPPRHSPGA